MIESSPFHPSARCLIPHAKIHDEHTLNLFDSQTAAEIVLVPDKDLRIPDFTILTASAGSGKTELLTRRYIQFLLSRRILYNKLPNVLAITFTNNAAIEMKQRVLRYLKRTALGDPKIAPVLLEILDLSNEELKMRAGLLVDEILNNYTDFQVQTIDSFLTRIMKSSAPEFGFPPEFNLVLESDALLDEAFALFAQEIASDERKRSLLQELIELLNEGQEDKRFIWNPYENLAWQIKDLYKRLGAYKGKPIVESSNGGLDELKSAILGKVLEIGRIVEDAGLELTSNYAKIVELARQGDLKTILDRRLEQNAVGKSIGRKYEETVIAVRRLQDDLGPLIGEYYMLRARVRYTPYLRAYDMITDAISKVQRQRGVVDLNAANKALATLLRNEQVPEIYFSLGERIYHFLIDEFQDTSPIQWDTLRPLIENSLGKEGSLFIVGDMKQAIYTFRGGDWRIMGRMLNREEFASVSRDKKELQWNFRSAGAIVEFSKKVFHELVPTGVDYPRAELSGLAKFHQDVKEDKKGKGYVEIASFGAPDPEVASAPERARLIETVADCRRRGYGYGDIAVLTPKNEDVVEVSAWLNEENIPFISHSNLDIRTRKTTGEILSLLRFLDSPVDDLAFASFILSDVFAAVLKREGIGDRLDEFIFDHRRSDQALYRSFESRFNNLWQKYFEHLFNVVGYLPVYDLIAEVYTAFDLFNQCPDEEAALVKLLEVMRDFETSPASGGTSGSNSLKDFLRYAEASPDEDAWRISVSPDADAVKVMTVHKAKGLGFPVTIVLLYDSQPPRENLFVSSGEDGIRLFYLTKAGAKAHEELARLLVEKEDFRVVDDLNKLYVALTRAEEEMYVLCVKSKKSDVPSKFLPPNGFRIGTKTSGVKRVEPVHRTAPVLHAKRFELDFETKPGRLSIEETKRGEFIHAVLQHIEYLEPDLSKQIDAILKELQGEVRESFDVREIRKFLIENLSDGMKPFFLRREGRKVMNEQEVVAEDGQLHRVDRIVVDPDEIVVIDYKTGGEVKEYAKQVQAYVNMVKQLYQGKKVRGLLAYIDLRVMREVG